MAMIFKSSFLTGRLFQSNEGYTLLELLLSIVVGSLVIGVAYSSYYMVSGQYEKHSDISNMHQAGRQVLEMISRDLRMSGYEAFTSSLAAISPDFTIAAGAGSTACFDSLVITYDEVDAAGTFIRRVNVTYSVALSGARSELSRSRTDAVSGAVIDASALLAVNLEYLQFFNYTAGDNTAVDIELVVRSNNQHGRNRTYARPAYFRGAACGLNGTTDSFIRHNFFTTVFMRNV